MQKNIFVVLSHSLTSTAKKPRNVKNVHSFSKELLKIHNYEKDSKLLYAKS